MGTESIKEKLADITKKVILKKALSSKPKESYSEFEDDDEDEELGEEDIEEIVDEIIEFVYLAAEEGKYEFEVGSYVQTYGARNYDKISYRLKQKLYDVMVIKWTNRKNLKVFWGNNEV